MDKKEERKISSKKIFEKTRSSAQSFKQEFKNQSSTAITAAFAFLIALSWREPITQLVQSFVQRFNLQENLVFYQFISAIIITLLGVLFLMLISKWNSKPEPK